MLGGSVAWKRSFLTSGAVAKDIEMTKLIETDAEKDHILRRL